MQLLSGGKPAIVVHTTRLLTDDYGVISLCRSNGQGQPRGRAGPATVDGNLAGTEERA